MLLSVRSVRGLSTLSATHSMMASTSASVRIGRRPQKTVVGRGGDLGLDRRAIPHSEERGEVLEGHALLLREAAVDEGVCALALRAERRAAPERVVVGDGGEPRPVLLGDVGDEDWLRRHQHLLVDLDGPWRLDDVGDCGVRGLAGVSDMAMMGESRSIGQIQKAPSYKKWTF